MWKFLLGSRVELPILPFLGILRLLLSRGSPGRRSILAIVLGVGFGGMFGLGGPLARLLPIAPTCATIEHMFWKTILSALAIPLHGALKTGQMSELSIGRATVMYL